MRIKLTKTVVDSQISGNSDRIIWDSELRGFGVRISPNGIRTYVVQYRTGGRGSSTRRYKLGRHGPLTTDAARVEAKRILGEVARGSDPSGEREARRLAIHHEITFEAAARDWLKRYVEPNVRSSYEISRVTEVELVSRWGSKPVSTISRTDVVRLLDGIVDRGSPVSANKALAVARMLFHWLTARGILEHAPTDRIASPARIIARDRVLADSEIARLWPSFEMLDWPFGTMMQLLLLTAQRRGEVAGMRWRDLDMAAALWTIPRDRTKSDRTHVVPLAPMTMQILSHCPRLDSEFVFPARGAAGRTMSGFSKAKARLDRLCALAEPWRVHDLRRTAATGMARLSVAPHVIEKILNHSSGSMRGVAAIYNRHQYLAERVEALNLWSKAVAGIMGEHEQTTELVAAA